MSFNSSCLRVPINPYSQQPSPSYERGLVAPHTEHEGSSARKFRVTSASSRPASSINSPVPKQRVVSKFIGGKQTRAEGSNNSPLDSFMDFYESIPDYQDVTHLSDKEFEDKLKLLRHKQREYLHNLDGRYSPRDFEENEGATLRYQKKNCKSVNKLELAKEWLNKSCDSLSSLGRKSENDYRIRTLEMENQSKKAPSTNVSPRKYVQYDVKNESETNIMDSGSSLSIDSHILKSKTLTPTFVVEEHKDEIAHNIQDCESPFTSTGRSESCQGISNLFGVKESSTNNYDFYKLQEGTRENHPSTSKKTSHQLCAVQSSETSELNVQDCNSHYSLNHHDAMTYEDYYVPSSGWMQSDSDSMLGTMLHMNSTRPSTAVMSQSLPGSPITKRSTNSSKTSSSKKKTRRKRRGPQKSVTKPVPFNFVSNERQYTRSTPDISSSHCRSPSPKLFRARPIPRNLFSNYVYQKKQDDEFFRALKRKVRAEEMLRAASLPPSMAFRERLGRGSLSPGSDSRRCRPRPRSGCPDQTDRDQMDLAASTSRSNLAALLRIQTAR
ncbi:uncharacterized protein LOC117650782 [Thrips palmi]|uniref:Uncharacterized protein LOC117650782 n=1 Tax=Thrips palmi TaxID=161013 RepID=A0A6P8ZYR4_THRPL|nr:uncharacterized protein LOC117650782 [Thrips palmi]